jgi:nucleotide-binding universal stress UspA family protein
VHALRAILVAIDFSPGSRDALEAAAMLASLHSASVDVLHVLAPSSAPAIEGRVARSRELRAFSRSKVGAAMRECLSLLEERGIPARGRLETGRAEDVVARLASPREYDLVVMATHGPPKLVRSLRGGTIERVVRRARCPVMTVRPRSAAAGRV